MIFGFVPATVVGSAGALLVHVVSRHWPTQWLAVLLAGAVGFLVVVVLARGTDMELAVLVGLAAAIGRGAVVPFIRTRAAMKG